MIDQRLIDLVSRQVPRYTSYPPAPFPEGGVGPHEYAVWLSALAGSRERVSLYLHVPYCREICFYCGCTTKATRRDAPLKAYAETLLRELKLVSRRTGRLPLSHIHWGGGTPSLLPEGAFIDLVAAIFESFDMSVGYLDHAIELDPRYVDRRLAERLAICGINRISLGVQDVDRDVQALIGRPQAFDTVRAAVAQLAHAGIDAFNFDLIYGLPGQTAGSMARTIEQVMTIRPDRIALFGYAHVPWMKTNQKRIDAAMLPSALSRLEISQTARDLILGAGYVPIGIDHFALPGDSMAKALAQRSLRRIFQGYTTEQAPYVIGLGVSSIGRIPIGYVQNASDVAAWRAAIEAGDFATAKGRRLTLTDRMRAEVIEALMCFFEADVGAIAARHGRSIGVFAKDLAKLQPLQDAGFVQMEGGNVRLVADEVMLARIVASAFDSHLVEPRRPAVAA